MEPLPLPRRPRRGSLERPVSTRIYRAAWTLVAIPLLVAAFTLGRAEPLPAPRLDPSFDEATAAGLASELARRFPDRSPGSMGARQATAWMSARLDDYGLRPERQRFSADLPGLGRRELVNLVAVAPGRSPEAIVVLAHRDNIGLSPGANDNASGTAALLELARGLGSVRPAHTLVFVSTDGGAYGGLGAAEFARRPALLKGLVGRGASVASMVNLDALAGREPVRLVFAGETPRSPALALVATAEARVRAETGASPAHARAVAQVLDLAFPFTLHEQGLFIRRGIPAVTLTTGAVRPGRPAADTLDAFDPRRLGELGRSAQALVTSLDQSTEVAHGTQSYVYLGTSFIRGWTIEFALLVALLPALAAIVDLFARCRRRHIALAPALRSLRSRIGVWLWAGALFACFSALGLLSDGGARPLNPDTPQAQRWPVAALLVLLALSSIGWLVARPRLAPVHATDRRGELGGHLAAMIALAIVALVVAAVNPYALVFVLPSLHAWLWLPHVDSRGPAARAAVLVAGLAGPLVLVGSLAVRFELGLDVLWYLPALAANGYLSPALVVAALVWAAIASQVTALALGRYAPYPRTGERPARGPLRAALRRLVLARRRARLALPEPSREIRSLEQ